MPWSAARCVLFLTAFACRYQIPFALEPRSPPVPTALTGLPARFLRQGELVQLSRPNSISLRLRWNTLLTCPTVTTCRLGQACASPAPEPGLLPACPFSQKLRQMPFKSNFRTFPSSLRVKSAHIRIPPPQISTQPLGTTDPLPVSIDLPVLDASQRWNHKRGGLCDCLFHFPVCKCF